MKMTMLLVAVALGLQTAAPAPARTPLSALVGKWATTTVPPPGEAPMGPPTFTLDVKGDVVTVTFVNTPPIVAEVFCTRGATPAEDVSLLLVKRSNTASSNFFYMIRPISAGVVRVEMYVESTDGRAKPSFYWPETFKKQK